MLCLLGRHQIGDAFLSGPYSVSPRDGPEVGLPACLVSTSSDGSDPLGIFGSIFFSNLLAPGGISHPEKR